MSFQVTTAFVEQYKAVLYMLVQQTGSYLRGTTLEESVVGKDAYFDQVGVSEAVQITTRHADTPLISTPHSRRRVSMVDYDWADLTDDMDKIKMLVDPTSSYAQEGAMAMGRQMDRVIISNLFGTAYTGVTGATPVTFPSTQLVAINYVESGSAVNSGLTIGKLRKAKLIMDKNNVPDDEERYIAVTGQQINDLLQSTEVTNSLYNEVRALVDGKINRFLGFTFKRTQLMPLASSTRKCAAYTRKGVMLALGKDINTSINIRPDKRNSTQVYVGMSLGATRMEEERVVEIDCLES